MAKKSTAVIRLVNPETGYFYIGEKSTKKTYKLKKRKYDPKLRKHVVFEEKRGK